MRAWFAGEFEQCLELCDGVRASDGDMISRLALLRARALLRLDQPEKARTILGDVFLAHGTVDASITAQMLLAAADVRLGAVQSGLARLDALQITAEHAHPAIRSEIALHRALGHYALRDLGAADAALDQVAPDSDIIYARALEYRGWIESARGRHDEATAAFITAIQHLDLCRHQDRFLEANALRALAHAAAERFDGRTWDFVEARAERMNWDADGLVLPRFWIAMNAALAYESNGAVLPAFKVARQATELAPKPAYRVAALCRRATIVLGAGEPISAADLADEAAGLLDGIPRDSLRGDERAVPLDVAEALALVGNAEAARRYFSFYRDLGPMNRVVAMSADPAMTAFERMVEATIAEAAGDRAGAHRGYGDAFRGFRAIGYTRRAATCALRLAKLTGADYLYEYVAGATRDLSPASSLRRAIHGRERLFRDSVGRRLTAVEREVLALVLEGQTNVEIAKLRDRSVNTIKHIVSRLLDAFGVATRDRLIVECTRRGIGGI